MKKIQLLMAALIISCFGCEEGITITKGDSKILKKTIVTLDDGGCRYVPCIYEIEIEGCQYFLTSIGTTTASLCHKGNCNNPIHPRNIESQSEGK